MSGSLQLDDDLGGLARLSCEKRGRAGQYRNENPIERNGAHDCAYSIAEEGQ